MVRSLRDLLDGAIDYAGLYPPAQLDMGQAVSTYSRLVNSNNAWLVDRFVCSATRLRELVDTLTQSSMKVEGGLDVIAVGTAITEPTSAQASLDADLEAIKLAEATGFVQVSSFEVKLPGGQAANGPLRTLKRALAPRIDRGMSVFLEFAWGRDLHEGIHEALRVFEEVGFKARTGGLTASAFPSSETLADFIVECVSLEAPFKFTAGLHLPIRHYDGSIGAHHHGFLNALVASALAATHDLTRREIEAILEAEHASSFEIEDESITVGPHSLSLEDIDAYWDLFSGFGSCSVDEPVEGLRNIGISL